MTPCGLYCFPVKSDTESESRLQFTNWRNTRDVFTGYVGRKLAVLHQMGIESLRCFISFILPQKRHSRKKNVTSGVWYFISPVSCNRQRSQRVQWNIVTQQNPFNLYRCFVRTERCTNIQAACSLQRLVPPRSLTLVVELRLQRRLRQHHADVPPGLLSRYCANAWRGKRALTKLGRKKNRKKLHRWNGNRIDQNKEVIRNSPTHSRTPEQWNKTNKRWN